MLYDDDRDYDRLPRPVRATCGECGCSTAYHAQGCPETPDDEDDRPLDELTPAEQRARLKTLSMSDLIEQCLESLDDARMWQQTAAANEAKAMRYLTKLITVEAQLKETRERLQAKQAAITAARHTLQQVPA